jgi:hypothetical protein
MKVEEFMERRDALKQELKDLEQEYIETNTSIKPKSFVMVDGQRMWLEKYTLVQHYIIPSFRRLNKNGQPLMSVFYQADDYKSMKAIEV